MAAAAAGSYRNGNGAERLCRRDILLRLNLFVDTFLCPYHVGSQVQGAVGTFTDSATVN